MRILFFNIVFLFSLTGFAQNFSLGFNGSTQYVSIPSDNSINLNTNFTIEGWVYPTGDGSHVTEGGIIINKESSYEIARFNDGTIRYALSAFGNGSDWDWINTGLVTPLNTWSHFAMVKTGTSVSFYLNGISGLPIGSNPASLTGNTQQLRIGGRTSAPQYFNGIIDEVRIWNTARTQAEIKANAYNKILTNNASGLAAYYRMNEGSGTTTINSSTNSTGINGTLVNSPTWNASPVQFSKNALAFDGTDDIVSIPHNSSLDITTAITIEAWVYATKNTGVQSVVGKSTHSNSNSFIFPRTNDGWSSAIIYFYIDGSWKNLSATYPSLNAWHHLAATYDGTTIKLYINGILANSMAQTGTLSTNSNSLILGNQPGFTEYFGGSLDELRIWNIARTQSEIQGNMNSELNPNTQTGLVSYYTFNQGIPTGTNTGLIPLMDQTGNNGGTLSNFSMSGSSSNFVDQFSGLFALPVSWLSFTAQKNNDQVLLTWRTAHEQNSRNFLVQRSLNGVDWKTIGTIAAAGNSNTESAYSFTDAFPVNSINYYRLLQQDYDDKFGYSKVVSVSMIGSPITLRIINNPVINNQLKLLVNKATAVTIRNSDGKILLQKQLNIGIQTIDLSSFNKGFYFLQTNSDTWKFVL
jgi:hypothetical protein